MNFHIQFILISLHNIESILQKFLLNFYLKNSFTTEKQFNIKTLDKLNLFSSQCSAFLQN